MKAIDKIVEELKNQIKQAKEDMADARQYGVNSAGFNAYMGRMEMAEQMLEEARRLAAEEAKEKSDPELLEALEDIMCLWESWKPKNVLYTSREAKARAAIAKAKGKYK